MPTKKKQQQQFDRFVAEQRDKRYPSVIDVIVKEAGYRYSLMRQLENALQRKRMHGMVGDKGPTMDEALARVAADFGLTYTPPTE